jgi:cellulose synthase/poly-beta-1,6-N-acetylglucosamine synthase-like glycosyltransferase
MSELTFVVVAVGWACAGLVFYTYGLYALLVWIASRGMPLRPPAEKNDEDLPTIAVLIAAHNEESVIEERIRNVLALDYPREKLELIIASDGSSDRTTKIANRYVSQGVRVMDYPRRRGKMTVLNTTVAELSAEIIVLSDANTFFDRQAARKLVRWFADSSIGAVCGKLVLTDRRTGRNMDGLYWKYETFIKKCESRLGALLGANGAIYAIRRSIFPEVQNDTLVDDFVIPLAAKLETGCRIVYEQEAIAHEEIAPDISDEFHRRARIGAGGYQAIGRLWKLVDPRRGWVALSFLSHKVLRWLCPFFMVGIIVCSMLASHYAFYRGALAVEMAFLLLSVPFSQLPGSGLLVRLLRLSAMFTLMNAALFVGFFRWLRGRPSGIWVRTLRSAELVGEPS